MLLPLERATPASCGAKAAHLRELHEHGLPVPPSVCLPITVYQQALPARLPDPRGHDLGDAMERCEEVIEALSRWSPSGELRSMLSRSFTELGGSLVVRSSATCEELAAGIFTSVLGVGALETLIEAIRACWISLWAPAAWAVLWRQQRWPGEEAMGVVVQREVRAALAGLVLSRDPRTAATMRLEVVEGPGQILAAGQADPIWVLLPREGPLPVRGPLDRAQLDLLRRAAFMEEQRFGTPAELEWVIGDDVVWLVQSRPSAAVPGPEGRAWEVEDDPQTSWHWDREHNPEPLSPAHTSLVEVLPGGLKVLHGFLFQAQTDTLSADPTTEPDTAGEQTLWQVWSRFQAQMVPHLARLEGGALELSQAVEFVKAFYEAYFGDLARARARARQDLIRFVRDEAAGDVELAAWLSIPADHETARRTRELHQLSRKGLAGEPALRDHLARYGTLAASWDVAAATLAERPDQLRGRLCALAELSETWRQGQPTEVERSLRSRLSKRALARLDRLLRVARLARRIEEDDDVLFSRALALVRRCLLEAGRRFVANGWLTCVADVFLLRIEEVQALIDGSAWDEHLAKVVERRRIRWEEQRRLVPPLTVRGTSLSFPPLPGGVILRGLGVGGVVRGEVRLVDRLDEMLGRDLHGAVVVCSTMLPSLAIVLPEISALVTDHGGLLSHAASLARELGKVAVVGTGVATRTLSDGERVWVDGHRGLVVREAAAR